MIRWKLFSFPSIFSGHKIAINFPQIMSKPQFCRKVRIYPKRIWSEKSQNFLQIILNLSVGALQRAANGRERKRMLELTRLFTELKKTLPTNGQILSKKDILLQVHTYIYTGCPPQNFGFAPVLSCRSWEGFFYGWNDYRNFGNQKNTGCPQKHCCQQLMKHQLQSTVWGS